MILNSPNGYPDCSLELRCFFLADNITPCHTPETVERSDSCYSYRSLPLTGYVVSLESVEGGPIRHVSSSGEESPNIPYSHLCGCGQTEHKESGYEHQGIEGDERSSDTVVISNERSQDDGNHGIIIWLCGEVRREAGRVIVRRLYILPAWRAEWTH